MQPRSLERVADLDRQGTGGPQEGRHLLRAGNERLSRTPYGGEKAPVRARVRAGPSRHDDLDIAERRQGRGQRPGPALGAPPQRPAWLQAQDDPVATMATPQASDLPGDAPWPGRPQDQRRRAGTG
jgi:hypothetical protein